MATYKEMALMTNRAIRVTILARHCCVSLILRNRGLASRGKTDLVFLDSWANAVKGRSRGSAIFKCPQMIRVDREKKRSFIRAARRLDISHSWQAASFPVTNPGLAKLPALNTDL